MVVVCDGHVTRTALKAFQLLLQLEQLLVQLLVHPLNVLVSRVLQVKHNNMFRTC